MSGALGSRGAILPNTLQKSGLAGVIIDAGVGPRSAVERGVAVVRTAESMLAAPLGSPIAPLAMGAFKLKQVLGRSDAFVPAPRLRETLGIVLWQETNKSIEAMAQVERINIDIKLFSKTTHQARAAQFQTFF